MQDGARIAFFVQEMIDSLAVLECVAEDDRALVLVLAQRVKQQTCRRVIQWLSRDYGLLIALTSLEVASSTEQELLSQF